MACSTERVKGNMVTKGKNRFGVAIALLVALMFVVPMYMALAANADSDESSITAQDTGAQDANAAIWDGSIDTSWYNPNSVEFTLTKPAQLAGLAAIVNGDAEGMTRDTFAGKTVRLGADITLNSSSADDVDNTGLQRSWVPIGRLPMPSVNPDGAEGAMPHYTDGFFFDGTFDGQGHLIKNLYIYDNPAGSYGGVQALFANVGGNATIQNVGLEGGYVYGRVAAGLVAISHVTEGLNKVPHIIGCYTNVTVVCNGSSTRGAGGIFGGEEQYRGESTEDGVHYDANYHGGAYIANCYNLGTITRAASGASAVGGIAGTGSVQIYGCYNRGSIPVSSPYAGSIAGNLIGTGYLVGQNKAGHPWEGNSVVHDSYALNNTVLADDVSLVKLYNLIDSKHDKDAVAERSPAITSENSTSDVQFKDANWFKDADDALSQSFDDSDDGFPILYWQHGASTWNINAKTYYDGWVYRIEDIPNQTYTGNPLTPALDIWYCEDESDLTAPEIELHAGSDYIAVYTSNTNVGYANVTVVGMGRFYNGRTVHFNIIDGSLENVSVDPILAQWYYGAVEQPTGIRPDLVIYSGSQQLSQNDLILEWHNNGTDGAIQWNAEPNSTGIRTATASVTISSNDETKFKGSKTAEFTILEASTSLDDAADANTKKIKSKADLQYLAYKTHTGNDIETYSSYNYVVADNIDATSGDDTYMTDRPCDPLFTSWGTGSGDNRQFIHGLSGIFDGNGKTITLEQTEDGVSFDLNPALGFMIYTKSGSNPTIKDLTIVGSISCPHGAAAGFLVMGQSGTITFDNCTNKAAVNGDAFYGGGAGGFIVQTSLEAGSELKMTNCTNEGEISSSAGRAGGFISALGGTGNNEFVNCNNTGDITGGNENGSGGIVAVQLGVDASQVLVTQTTTTFTRCSNTGSVVVGNSDVGGILGYSQDAVKQVTLDRCFNRGKLQGGGAGGTGGGLVGRIYNSLSISNSYNSGNIKMLGYYANSPGGLVGYFGNYALDYEGIDTVLNLTNCYSSGDLDGSSENPGGLVSHVWLHTTINLDNVYFDNSSTDRWLDYNPAEKWPGAVDPPEINGQATAIDASAMRSPAFVSMLSLAFGRDDADNPVNRGLPVILATDREMVDISDASKATITLSPTTWEYTGAPIKPTVTVICDGATLAEGTDFVVFYTNDGTNGRAIVQGIGDFKNSKDLNFTITPCSISACAISNTSALSYADVAGGSGEQDIVLTNPAGGIMQEGSDYRVVYAQNDAAGTAYLRIEGIGPLYTGDDMRMFTIEKGDLGDTNQVAVTEVDEHYPLAKGTGGLYIYEQLVARSGYVLERADTADTTKDYARQFYYVNSDGTTGDIVKTADGNSAATSIMKAGTYRARFMGSAKRNTGAGVVKWTNENWENYAEATFTYGNRMPEDAAISGIASKYPYTGNTITIEPTLMNKLTDYPLEKGTDYTVTITDKNGDEVNNLVSTGSYTLTINSAGNDWFGTVSYPFEVVPSEYYIDESTVVEGIQDSYLSTGSAITPVPTAVKIGSHALSSSDFTVSYQDAKGNDIDAPVKSGTYYAVITGKGDYTGVKRVPFTIEDPLISVYVRTGANGEATLARAFTRDEFIALKSDGGPVSALYCDDSGMNWKVATAKEYVTLDDLVGAAGIQNWGSGASVSYGGDGDKSSTSFSYDELQNLMFYPGTTSSATDSTGGVKAPFVFSIADASNTIGSAGTVTAYDVQELNIKNARTGNMPRAIMGLSSEDYSNARANAAAKTRGMRLWSKTSEIVVTLPEPKPDPTPEVNPDPKPNPKPTDPDNGNSKDPGNSGSDKPTDQVERLNVFRLYNPNSGEHFYTLDSNERDNLASLGWNYEGISWVAPSKSALPVYRMYNSAGSEHHYTLDASERDFLVSVGWNYEGISWYSDEAQGMPLYRLYNPNAFANNHHYTADAAERDWLFSLGWHDEGIGWYGLK